MASKKSQRKRANPIKKRKVYELKGMKIGIAIIIIVVIAASAVYLYSGISEDGNEIEVNGNNSNGSGDNGEDANGNGVVENPIAIIDTSMGTIKVELYQDKVPNTTENFIKLANDGFYNNLVFHRVIDDFMIQGGGFYANGTHKKSPYGSIDLEINLEVRHVDGAIAMARTSDPNSATSQFYICDGPQSYLDNNYAVFGVVIDGMDVVRAIAALYPEYTTTKYGMQDWPIDDVIINSITIESY